MRASAASVRALATPAALARAGAASARAAAWLRRRYRLVLAGVVVAQWGGVAAIALTARHNGWLYYHGGDGTWYWSAAWALGHFRLPHASIGYGLSVLWSPAGAALGPSLFSGLPFVVLLNTLLLLPLVPLLLYGVAERIAGRLFGLLAAALWLAVPLLAYRMFSPSYHARLLDNFLPGATGLNSIADFPSLVACLAAAYFALRAVDNRARPDALMAGLLAGFAVGIKPANALFLPAPALGLLVARRYPALVAYAAGVLPAVVALAAWKERGLGNLPILSGAGAPLRLAAGTLPIAGMPDLGRYGGIHWSAIQLQLAQIREIFWSKALLEWCAIAGTFGLLRRSFAKGLVVVAWFAAYFLVKGSSPFASVYATSFFRLLEPAYPAFLLMAAASAALLLPRRGRRPAPSEPPRPAGRRLVATTALVLGALPLLLVATARPAPASRFAEGLGDGVYVPVVDLHAAARAGADGAVHLTWAARRASTGSVAYRIFRAATEGADCTPEAGGVPGCQVSSAGIANRTGTSFVDRPGPGRWIYRVAVTGSYDGKPAGGDPLLLSPPLAVSVR